MRNSRTTNSQQINTKPIIAKTLKKKKRCYKSKPLKYQKKIRRHELIAKKIMKRTLLSLFQAMEDTNISVTLSRDEFIK